MQCPSQTGIPLSMAPFQTSSLFAHARLLTVLCFLWLCTTPTPSVCKPSQVAVAMNSAETTLANVKAALSRVLTEAEGYPDLIRAYHNTETGQANPLVQVCAGWVQGATVMRPHCTAASGSSANSASLQWGGACLARHVLHMPCMLTQHVTADAEAYKQRGTALRSQTLAHSFLRFPPLYAHCT
jgi:hypothetical protein